VPILNAGRMPRRQRMRPSSPDWRWVELGAVAAAARSVDNLLGAAWAPLEAVLLLGLGGGVACDAREDVQREYTPEAVYDRGRGVARVLVEFDDCAR
jgi:hypothetical protein